MAEIALPEPQRPAARRAIVIDVAELAGAQLFAVTIWPGVGRPPRRQWFTDRAIAIAHAAERADELAAPMIDLTDETGNA